MLDMVQACTVPCSFLLAVLMGHLSKACVRSTGIGEGHTSREQWNFVLRSDRHLQ